MAKKTKIKSGKGRRGSSADTVKIIALIVFIVTGITVVGGTVWYYAFFQPRSAEEMIAATQNFTQEFFNVAHSDITGREGAEWMTDALAQETASGDRVRVWQERELISRVEGDVEVKILDQGLRKASVRAIFWQYEELEEKTGKEFLVYYDYDFVYADGSWLINTVGTANEEELKDLRKARGVYDQHYADEEEDAGQDEEGTQEDGGSE